MNVIYKQKANFTENYLQPLLRAVDQEVEEVGYAAEEDDKGYLYNELVIITFQNGYTIEVNVHMDSLLAMAKDALREMPL
ncbi:MAG: hypothetical protein RSG53_07800 [Oscillospiraceae bacterium]